MTTIPMLQKELEQAYKDIKYYKNRIERLNNQLQQKENILKEVREYITYWHYRNDFRINSFTTGVKEDLLGILDKENNNE